MQTDMLQLWNRFVLEKNEQSYSAFGVWLIKNEENLLAGQKPLVSNEPAAPTAFYSDSALAGMLIGRMYRFVKVKMKPRLKKTGFSNLEEFIIMGHLFGKEPQPKVEVLKQTISEIAAGSQMIDRLVVKGHIKEQSHPVDKRVKLITLTAKGSKQLLQLFRELDQIEDVLGDLSKQERETIVMLLQKLDLYHSDLNGIETMASK
ncbi:MarR family winged helix-turn-helix transcriptional regulator [Lacibacter sp. H407]|uniref:MarR family winged helix-turn-helix transcriptional regulator n=1 Tax=Lacibacter sp. H407 TaxID=3133423 RepID=UPI0030C50189